MGDHFLVLDAGTGSARSVIFDRHGNQVAIAQQEWTHRSVPEYEGAIDFDTQHNWPLIAGLIRRSLREAGIAASRVAAITSTSMREGFVLYDGRGREIWACSNVDARSSREITELKSGSPSFEKEIYGITGQTLALSAIPRFRWLKKHRPRLLEQVRRFSMLSDWILYRLCGQIHVEPSNGSTSGLLDLKTRNWSEEVLRKCDLPADIFPSVKEPGSLIGQVTKEAAQDTGLEPATPVIEGGGDAQLGCIGLGAICKDEVVILGGTFWQQEYNLAEPLFHKDAAIRVDCHAVPSLWQLEGVSFLVGQAVRWFREAFFQKEKAVARELGIDPYVLLCQGAQTAPLGSHGVIPVLSDVMNYANWKHATPSFLNLDIGEGRCDRYVLFRALLENACYVALGNCRRIMEVTGRFPEQTIFAGGASKSPFWAAMLADVLNVRIGVPRVREATALGGAILAGVGVGAFAGIEEAVRSLVRTEAFYEPSEANHRRYMEFYEKWRRVYPEMLALSDKGLLKHLWRAGG